MKVLLLRYPNVMISAPASGLGVEVEVGVLVGVLVGVFVGVLVAVGVDVAVLVGVSASVGVSVGVSDGTGVSVSAGGTGLSCCESAATSGVGVGRLHADREIRRMMAIRANRFISVPMLMILFVIILFISSCQHRTFSGRVSNQRPPAGAEHAALHPRQPESGKDA